MLHIFLGLIGMIAGAAITIYSEKMLNAFGRIPIFDKYLGLEGGSRLGYKLIGIFIFFFGILQYLKLLMRGYRQGISSVATSLFCL